MDRQDITHYIIRELGKHHPVRDITIAVCEKTGMKWDEAQQFVGQIQVEHKDEIIRRRKPLFVLMAVTSIVIGLTLSITILVLTLNGLIIFLLRLPIPYLGNLLLFGFGVMMVGGGVTGLLNMAQELEAG
jgi:hypothetical protein